jgi:hypothetical protein
MKTPHESHWKVQKGYFSISWRYNSVWDTLQFRGTPLLVGFTDSDWAGDLDDQSLLQVMFSVLVLNLSLGLVRSNVPLALSSTKVEYRVAMVNASQEALWLQ